jgi:hypothetical protein
VTESVVGFDLKLSGAAGSFGVHLGGAVGDGIILAAHAFDIVVASPSVRLSSPQGSTSMPTQNTSLGGFGFGPELTFYGGASNIYVSLTAAAYRLVLTEDGADSVAKLGYGGRIAVGKEWWVTAHRGLGVCAQLTASVNADVGPDGSQPRLTGLGATIGFSATFN